MLMVRSLSLMALLIVGLFTTLEARAENQETLTLSCDGTLTNAMSTDNDTKTESFTKMGLLVNLAEGTVLGFGTPARIKKTDAVSVEFAGEVGGASVSATIDRITGSVLASTYSYNANLKKIISSNNWDMHCKPTKRVF
jgi:hypothetical protein